jgi:hypothetical protein
MEEGLTTALNLQKSPANDLCVQDAQMVLTLKMYIYTAAVTHALIAQ